MPTSKTGKKNSKNKPAATRLARHRASAARRGIRRVEVAVPGGDIGRVRKFARILREGGMAADLLRNQVKPDLDSFKIAKTGAEFMERSRRIIGEGVHLELPPRECYPEDDEPVFGQ